MVHDVKHRNRERVSRPNPPPASGTRMAQTPRVAIVTGASSGIGEATALHLIREGWTVYGGARRVDKMDALEKAGGRALALDVTEDESMDAFVQTVLANEGRIDALVGNAGYGSYGAVEDVPLAEARRQFDVNLFGLARMIQLVLPTMRAQRAGTIVNVSSMGGKMYTPMGAWYHATKHALEGFSDCLRYELKPHGVRVVIVEPGAIQTEWGGIAADSLMETSGDGAYAETARATKKAMDKAYEKNGSATPPEVIARTIGKAVSAKKPKTRYLVGQYAKPLVALRHLLPDRGFDAVLRSQYS